MPGLPFEEERQQLLASRQRALLLYNQRMDESESHLPWSKEEDSALADAETQQRAAQKAEQDYFDRLPRVVMSCCPFDGKLLTRSFDRYGLDGLWWRSDASPSEVPTCPHFCFLRGAVSLGTKKAHGGDFEAHIGPEIPYVIARILQKEGVMAVISHLEMSAGQVAYIIAYFAQRRPAAAELAANWPRTNYVYATGMGQHRWRMDDEVSDFELGPWLEKGKIRWCRPGGDNKTLSDEPSSACPYLKVKGRRERMVIQRDRVWSMGAG
jgi:hypothetical protein